MNYLKHIVDKLAYLILLLLLCLSNAPNNKTVAAVGAVGDEQSLKLNYRLILDKPKEHLFEIHILVKGNRAGGLDFAIPAWSPGRYVIYDFARNVQEFSARTSTGQILESKKIDKQTWHVECKDVDSLEVSYKVFADDLSGTFSQFNELHANYNGASIYMYLVGHKQDPIDLKIEKPANWKIVSGAAKDIEQTEFHFNNYDLLVDTPTEIGNFELETFTIDGRSYRVSLHSLIPFTEKAKLVSNVKRIVETETAIFGPPDFDHYTFLVHIVSPVSSTDGMEHLNSTQIIEPSLERFTETAAHEFFHLWNVKRIRPIELGPWDYSHEVYTKSLWISEGITSYYGDLSLERSGIWSKARYYQALALEIEQLQERPGRKLMSAEGSSWDTWLYIATPRAQITNVVNTAISYYNKGEILGLLLDLEIRNRTSNRKSLDDVFRYMYGEYYLNGKSDSYYLKGHGFGDGDFLLAVNRVAGSDFSNFFKAYVSGTEEIDYNHFLAYVGLKLEEGNLNSSAYQIKEIHASQSQQILRESWLSSHTAARVGN